MAYSTYTPQPVLQPFVEKIAIEESKQEVRRSTTRIIPTGTIDLLFHYGDPFVHLSKGAKILKPSAYIAGQRTCSFDVAATGRTGIVIARLKPWGLSGFTRAAVSEFTNQFVDLGSVFPEREVSAVIDALRNEPLPWKKAELVQSFLIARLMKKTDDLVVAGLQALYKTSPGKISALTAHFGISKRQLDRRFLEHVGLTPKKIQTIIRFQRSLAQLQTNLCRTAHDAGYFDQSHMNHDYQRFIAATPSHVLDRSAATPLTRFYARPANMSQFYNRLHLQ